MEHGVWLTGSEEIDPAALVSLGVAAEEAGWDGVFVSDSLPFVEYPDPWVVLSGMAARTEAVRLGTWVVPLPRRDPVQVAMEVATLDRLSDGRVTMGVGLGNDDDYDAYGVPYEPRKLGERFDEALEVIAGLWEGEPFSYDGEHFTLEDAVVQPTPVQEPRVPILAGCWWPNKKPLHRGAAWDGIMPFWPSLTVDGTGPNGEAATGDPLEELEAVMNYYHDVTDDPGTVLVPSVDSVDPGEYVDTCEDFGVTWILQTGLGGDADEVRAAIREGPPE